MMSMYEDFARAHHRPSARPASAWTNDSLFADSAISMGSTTPTVVDDSKRDFTSPTTITESLISDRLKRLSATAWVLEQDGPMQSNKRRHLDKLLDEVEFDLEEVVGIRSHGEDDSQVLEETADLDEALGTVPQEELQNIHNSLAATVASMRMRQQEQRHLHQLSVQRLEAIAQTCVVQEAQLQELGNEVFNLRKENQTVGQENDQLHEQLGRLRSESTKREVAVTAMSSAVAGLEGWINNSPENHRESPHSTILGTPRRTIVRGRGRFRGRYYVDELKRNGESYGLDGIADARELHDGVKAWLRGFRDVEEELFAAGSGVAANLKKTEATLHAQQEEWGEFERVAT